MSDAPYIKVFGDSHSKFFFEGICHFGRIGVRSPAPFRVVGKAINAASVAGLRGENSTLNVASTIKEELPLTERLLLAFGQVDLELGYYYRLCVKKESKAPEEYVEWLIDIYSKFLDKLSLSNVTVALKGVNLTALSPKPFALRYISRIVTEGKRVGRLEREQLVRPFLLSEDKQNEMHLMFNSRLKNAASEKGFLYFDLVQQTSDGWINGQSTGLPRLTDDFKTGYFDHHLADTVRVRRLHFEAAGRAFGFI